MMMGADGQPTLDLQSADISGLAQVFTGLQLVRRPRPHRSHQRALLRRQRPTSSATGGRCRTTTSTRRTPASTRSARRTSSADDDRGRRPRPTPTPTSRSRSTRCSTIPNVGPFIGKQLIQRLVTQQPEPGLCRPRRGGVRQQRQRRPRRHEGRRSRRSCSIRKRAPSARRRAGGKLREPVLRLAHMLRAFDADLGQRPLHRLGPTDDPATQLEPVADVRAVGLQLLPPGLCAAGQASAGASGAGRPEMQITQRASRSPAT